MRNPVLATVLVLLALIPIAVWAYTAYGTVLSYQMAEAGSRKTGQAAAILILVLAGLTPAFAGAIAMIAGAVLLDRKPLGARVTATVGLALVMLTIVVFIAFEGGATGREMFAAAALYVFLHAGVLFWLWKSWRRRAL